MEGLAALARCGPGARIVIVSHDAVNRELLVAMDPGLGDPDQVPQDNGCFNTLIWRDQTWTVLNINEIPT
jgi:broad specificity phosphatase PhoE